MSNEVVIKNLFRLLMVIFFCAAIPAKAIVSVDQALTGAAKDGLQAQIGIQLSGSSGNTEELNNETEGLLLRQQDGRMDYLQVQFAYNENAGVAHTQKGFIHVRHRQMVEPNFAWEAFAQIGSDRFTRLKSRGLLGGGVRWDLHESDRIRRFLGLGAFRESELIDVENSTQGYERNEFWRANSYFVFRYRKDDRLTLGSTTFFQPRFGNAKDWRILEQFKLAFDVDQQLAFVTKLSWAYDNDPPLSVHRSDIFFSSGFEYAF